MNFCVDAANSSGARSAKPGRSLAVLITGAAMMQAALMAASPASTLLFAEVFGDRWGGVPVTAGVLGTAAGSLALTYLMGRMGRRFGLIASYTVAAVGGGLAIAGALVEPLLAVGGLFLIGGGGAGSQLARYAGAELYPESRKGFALGAVVWAGSVGAVGGSAMLAPASDAAGRVGLPPLAGALLLAVIAAGVAVAVSTRLPRFSPPARCSTSAKAPLRLLASLPAARMALVAMVVNQVVMVAIMTAAPLHMHHLGDDLGRVGLVISAHVLGMYALAPLSGYLADRFGSRRVLVAGLLLTGGSVAALISAPHLTGAGLSLVLFVVGYGWNLSMVGGSALLVHDVEKTDQLRVQGGVEAAVWSASAFATFISTQMFAAGGYQLLAAASLALIAVPLFYIARSHRTPSTDEPTPGPNTAPDAATGGDAHDTKEARA